MADYLYNSSSTIQKIAFRKADSGAKRAYLIAGDHVQASQIVDVVKAVLNAGMYAVHTMCDGKPALEVRGYLFEKSVNDLLATNHFVQGTPREEKEPDKGTFLEKMRARTLQGTSAFFVAADASYAQYGYHKGHPEDVAAGIAYGIGSATMGLIGTNAQAVDEIRKQTKKLLAYTKEQGIDTSKSFTVPIVTENNKRDVFHQIVDFLQTYPTEIGNSFTSLAGVLIARSAWKYRVAPDLKALPASASKWDVLKGSGAKDIGLGFSTLVSGMIGGWMKEKNHDPDVPYKPGIAGWMEWIMERPLSVAAFGYMCSTAFHAISTIQDYKKAVHEKSHTDLKAMKFRAGFIGCTIIGEALMMLSSKGHGEGVKSDPSTEDSVLSIAAEIIVQQKPAIQAELINNIGTFLGRADVLGGKDADMKLRLTQKVEMMKHNPWAHALAEACGQTISNPSAMPKTTAPLPAWQSKLAASQAVPPVLGF